LDDYLPATVSIAEITPSGCPYASPFGWNITSPTSGTERKVGLAICGAAHRQPGNRSGTEIATRTILLVGVIDSNRIMVLFCRRRLNDWAALGDGETLMNKGREIRVYDYVNHPYERVRDALRNNAVSVFQSATKAAASRAQSVAAELHVEFGGIGVNTDVKISVKNVEEKAADAVSATTTRLRLEWEAAAMPRLFPVMNGELAIYPLTATETQLDFRGLYEPPFGAVGKTMNAIVGHLIAEASVHRFVSDVAGYLRQALS
jgi:hypothetical protein